MVNVVDALRITSFCFSPNQTHPGTIYCYLNSSAPCEVQLNHPQHLQVKEKNCSLKWKYHSGFHDVNINSSGIYMYHQVTSTMKEAEALFTIQDQPLVFEFDLKLSVALYFLIPFVFPCSCLYYQIDERCLRNGDFEKAFGTIEVLPSLRESNVEVRPLSALCTFHMQSCARSSELSCHLWPR